MILNVRKDFMVFEKRDLLWRDLLHWLFICSKQCLPIKLTRLLCQCFVNSGFPQKTNFAYYKYTVKVLKFMEKKGRQMKYFQKLYEAAS